MRILLVSRSVLRLSPDIAGGAERVAYHLAKELAEMGHEVHYVLDVGALPAMLEGVIGHDVSTWYKKAISGVYASFAMWLLQHLVANLLAARTAITTLRRERYNFDIIHGHGNLATLLLCLTRGKVPIVFTEHDPSPWLCQYRGALERAIRKCIFRVLDIEVFRHADHTILVSQSIEEDIVKRWKIAPHKVTTIPNGVDLELFNSGTGTDPGGESMEIEPGYCLFVGTLASRKGVDDLLRALVDIPARCVIVGGGPQRGELTVLTEKLGLSKRVSFLGPIPHVQLPTIYRKASMLVLPSVAEGLPLALLEAMACGIPPIATSTSGIPEAVQDGYNGLLIPPGNIDELSAAIQRLSADKALREELGYNARQTVVEKFTWEATAQRTVEVYESLLHR